MLIKRKINCLITIGIVIGLTTACKSDQATPLPSASPLKSPLAVHSPLPTAVSPVLTPTFDPTINYGVSQEQPAPIGAPVRAEDGLTITVLEVKRNAEEELVSINPFNMFYPDQEAVLIHARVELAEVPPQPFTLLMFDFDIVDEAGTVYVYPLTVIVADELKAYLERAVTLEGYLAFVLPRGHTQLTMQYLPKDRGQTYSPRWFNLTP